MFEPSPSPIRSIPVRSEPEHYSDSPAMPFGRPTPADNAQTTSGRSMALRSSPKPTVPLGCCRSASASVGYKGTLSELSEYAQVSDRAIA